MIAFENFVQKLSPPITLRKRRPFLPNCVLPSTNTLIVSADGPRQFWPADLIFPSNGAKLPMIPSNAPPLSRLSWKPHFPRCRQRYMTFLPVEHWPLFRENHCRPIPPCRRALCSIVKP